MFSNNRNELRQVYYTAWKKYKNKQLLDNLEKEIVDIILLHPEYHTLLDDKSDLDKDFIPGIETHNPFLHMSLHHAVAEQLKTDKPDGIRTIYQQLAKKHSDHEAAHLVIEILGEIIWQANQTGNMFDSEAYIDRLKKLV